MGSDILSLAQKASRATTIKPETDKRGCAERKTSEHEFDHQSSDT
jgi:hypothetical protein